MFKLPTIFLTIFSLLVFSNLSLADAGDRKIRFSGELLEGTEKRQSVKQIENQFTLFTQNIYNPWEKESATYSGILVDQLLTKFAKEGVNKIVFKAIDDYQIEMDLNTLKDFQILLVTKQNGEYLEVKDKGPMRIVFPDYDASKKEYEDNLPMWMWMINRIEFH